MFRMQNLGKIYRTASVETTALDALDIEVARGEFVAGTGPSGSEKSTFLAIAGLLEFFTSGDYLLDGINVRDLDDDARSAVRDEKSRFHLSGIQPDSRPLRV